MPTRLLDWTESIFLAAYFAVAHEPCNENAVVWALSPEILNWHFAKDWSIFLLEGPDGRSLVEGAFNNQPCVIAGDGALSSLKESGGHTARVVLAVLAPQVDARMMVQHSTFTLHADGSPLEKAGIKNRFLLKFTIPKRYRQHLTEDLRVAGVHRSTLFPNLDNLAQFLREAFTTPPPTII